MYTDLHELNLLFILLCVITTLLRTNQYNSEEQEYRNIGYVVSNNCNNLLLTNECARIHRKLYM